VEDRAVIPSASGGAVRSDFLSATSARSLVFDLFGDYIRYAGEAIGLAALCELLEPFGVSPEAVRMVMTRLRSEGWFESEKDGRTVTYLLSPKAVAMLDEGRDRIFHRDTSPWDGSWHLAIYQVPEQQRQIREALRKRLTFLGYGPLAPATWISARDHSSQVLSVARDLALPGAGLRISQMVARTAGDNGDRELAQHCWRLSDINQHYVEWMSDWSPAIKQARLNKLSGSEALIVRVNLVRSFRSFPFIDPELPPELLPRPWHGLAAHEAFTDAHRVLEGAATAYFRSVITRSGRLRSGAMGAPLAP
jgi:phenylacetic acid degradation operon negative regulatory protein